MHESALKNQRSQRALEYRAFVALSSLCLERCCLENYDDKRKKEKRKK